MSDTIFELSRAYEENVLEKEHPRSIGLFTIPEYPELEASHGMWSAALEAILTTLRYLAPATLLTLFWGQESFLFRLLKSIDNALRALIFSSEEQKEDVLQWLAEAGPVRVEHLDTVWRHGWILCGVLDAALPGACAGHPPTRQSLKHAQTIADHYLGVEPVFSRQELESNDSLSKHQEWKLATFLDRVRQALAKVSPPVSKPPPQRTSAPETPQFTLDYVARGSGLVAAQVRNKVYFKIYPTAQQCLDPGEITILIKGPRDTYGMAVIPPIFGKAQLIRQKLLGLHTKPTFTENALPITQGVAYLRSYGKNDMNKTYFIPKDRYDIEIDIDTKPEHSKIGYTVNHEGRHEISITSRGHHIVGSPFSVTSSQNIIDILQQESFCLEDGEEIDILDVKSDRKVVLRIVDFVTEKMLLKENGTLEKISDDEAKILMATDENQNSDESLSIDSHSDRSLFTRFDEPLKPQKFNTTAQKILKMNRVCKIFNSIMAEKQDILNSSCTSLNKTGNSQDVPDIVNSTLNETQPNRYVITDKHDTFIIPENISVSLRTEKPKPLYEQVIYNENEERCELKEIPILLGDDDNVKIDTSRKMQEDTISISSSRNPFLNEIYEQNYITEKALGSFVNTEYETNRSQSEETATVPINIYLEEPHSYTPSPVSTNPFIEPDIMERPKTPVLKILTGDITHRNDSIFVKGEHMNNELKCKEIINPFFMHPHPINDDNEMPINVTDFIIGAPVSVPPTLRVPTPEPDLEYLMMENEENVTKEQNYQECVNEVFSTPTHNNKSGRHSTESLTFHSLDSDATENVEIINLTTGEYTNSDTNTEQRNIAKSLTPKRDIWDSAYVSIDDSNSSPDTNNNESSILCDIPRQRKNFTDISSLKSEDISKMGPAERQLWLTCSDLNIDDSSKLEQLRPCQPESKRMAFTPIIEETDRSISSALKELSRNDSTSKQGGLETITVAFAELNDMYHEYFTSSDSLTSINKDKITQNNEIQYTVENINIYVDSASESITDVKRRAKQLEGEISEVQSNVTESVSASQTLQNQTMDPENNNDQIKFGSDSKNNIVLERKKYWDDKIREIEAKSDEIKATQKKRRLSSKHLRQNDSLTKKRGKEIAKKMLTEGGAVTQNVTEIIRQKYPTPQASIEEAQTDGKLVEKWKKYWDDKLEVEKEETDSIRSRSRSPKSIDSPIQMRLCSKKKDTSETNQSVSNTQSSPTRQELPEEVFIAFETSPKRFFGTSRKQILNKIDSFFARPSVADQSSDVVCGAKYESGLVSSRISLFHNISQKEQVPPWKHRKSRSMHNIYQRKDSEKNIASSDEVLSVDIENKRYQYKHPKENTNDLIKSHETLSNIKTPEDTTSIKDKRARMTHKIYHNTFDETFKQKLGTKNVHGHYGKNTKQSLHCKSHSVDNATTALSKTTISKSEMDIFSKTTVKLDQDALEKYKSCEELPKINVKNVISIFETATKSATKPKFVRKPSMGNPEASPLQLVSQIPGISTKPLCTTSNSTSSSCSPQNSSSSGISSSPSTLHSIPNSTQFQTEFIPIEPQLTHKRSTWIKNHEKYNSHKSMESETSMDSIDIEIISMSDKYKQGSYENISDIDVEIVERNPEISLEPTPDREIVPELKDYKSRFKMAKNYFKSLEELRETKKPSKLNECELMLYSTSDESPDQERPQKRVKKNMVRKSQSMPSSEISKAWEEMHKNQDSASSNSKLVKISEKFNVDDLFNDVMEGRLSRQGSLRGIPHKKAVLETFRSMENVSVNKLSSYEMAVSQLNQFATENQTKSAQTYLTEYPYLPTTDPSKYHSRFDAKASGLITMKELLNKKPRRNSVPDLRLDPTFTVDL